MFLNSLKGFIEKAVKSNLNLIPHIIHYCWFGQKDIPKDQQKYIKSWEKHFKGWKIVKWDESNFPIDEYPYAKSAYDAGKMAFVSDVARIYALEKMGGVYFDTDVEVIRNFEELLVDTEAILGTEEPRVSIGTGFMAFAPHNTICQALLKHYSTAEFAPAENGIYFANTELMALTLKDMFGISASNEIEKRGSKIIVFPQDYFTAYDGYYGKTIVTPNTRCIHHFKGSWFSPRERIKNSLRKLYRRTLKRK